VPAERFLAALAGTLPTTPVFVGSGALDREPQRFGRAPQQVEAFSPVRPAAAYGRAGERVLHSVRARFGAAAARPEALYGYAAARLVLDAVRAGGARRPAVVRAAFAPGAHASPVGRLAVTRSGDVDDAAMTGYGLKDGAFEPLGGAG
jgi:hypothetical protein